MFLMYILLFGGVLCLTVLLCLFCVHSSFAIILMMKRKLAALLLLSYGCVVAVDVLCLFLMVPWVGLQYVTVVFLNHTQPSKPCFVTYVLIIVFIPVVILDQDMRCLNLVLVFSE